MSKTHTLNLALLVLLLYMEGRPLPSRRLRVAKLLERRKGRAGTNMETLKERKGGERIEGAN
jgi:hypothetical protein